MNGFVSFVTAFCTSCIVLGGLYMLMPRGNMSKSVKYVFSLCFVCCIIAVPLSGTTFSLDFDIPDTQQSDISASAAQLVFSEALRSADIEFSKITVVTDKSSSGSIVISEVIIYTQADESAVRAVTENGENYKVSVINE